MQIKGLPRGQRMARDVASKPRSSRHLEGLPRARACVPTLYKDGDRRPPRFDPACMLVLVVLEDAKWDGRWRLEPRQEARLLARIEAADSTSPIGKLINLGDDGEVSLGEIQAFIREDKNWQWVQALPKAVHGILNQDIVRMAINDLDEDGSGKLGYNEWHTFLERLEDLHAQFLLSGAFSLFRAFYGRGQRWAISVDKEMPATLPLQDAAEAAGSRWSARAKQAPGCFQVGVDPDGGMVPKGWAADLYYYICNNHPLWSILSCDPNNPLNALERLAMEVATFSFVAMCQVYASTAWEKKHDPYALASVLASMVMWWCFYLLFTCPRLGRIDFSTPHASAQAVQRAKCCGGLGAALGYMLMSVFLAFLGWVIYAKFNNPGGQLSRRVNFLVLLGQRAKSYLISLLLVVGIYFNPFVAWGQPDPDKGFNLGDYIGLGQWRIEKQRFQFSCATFLEENMSKWPVSNSSIEEAMKACGCSRNQSSCTVT